MERVNLEIGRTPIGNIPDTMAFVTRSADY